MNFSELAKATRLRCGMQGSGPDTLSEAIGPEALVVQCVVDSWLDLQNYRENWKWMRTSVSFNIGAIQNQYTLTDIFGITNRFKRWDVDNFYFMDTSGKYSDLWYLEYNDFIRMFQNEDTGRKPKAFTIVPEDNSLLFTPVNGTYNIKAPYYKSPQVLTNPTDIPELPTHFHWLIIYGAIEKFCVSIGSSELYAKYSFDHSNLLGSLLRSQNPSKKMKMRSIA